MSEDNIDNINIDDLLNQLKIPSNISYKETLKEIFDRRVNELGINTKSVLELLKMEHRTVTGILTGKQTRVDFINLIKVADFLQLSTDQVIQLYLELLKRNYPDKVATSPEKIEFIKDNFDLTVLKKAGFINSISDFDHIEKRLTAFFKLNSILDYKKPPIDVAFSAGLVKPKNELTRSFWIKVAKESFEEIANPNEYDRKALIAYFPEIRWHSTNVELGLLNIIKNLFKMGITVIYQASLPSLHLRGATFAVNGKPCIVITDYVGFYPTLWFALIHELFHVIFDWEEIKTNMYHLSDEKSEQLTVIEREDEANNFAREYLLSKEKTQNAKPFINDDNKVGEYAKDNHVHPSFVYVFNAWDSKNSLAWARAKKQNPQINNLLSSLQNPWNSPKSIIDFAKSVKYKLYQ